jgi:hypothetical protein
MMASPSVVTSGPTRRREWSATDRKIAIWSSSTVFALGLGYVPTMVAGFIKAGSLSEPLRDPFLAIMELLIVLMAPAIVVLLAVSGKAIWGRIGRIAW